MGGSTSRKAQWTGDSESMWPYASPAAAAGIWASLRDLSAIRIVKWINPVYI
jgi:hypothetical protein